MKRLLLLLLLLLLTLILCLSAVGCNKATDGTTEPEKVTENTTESAVEVPKENIDGVVTRYLTERSERNIISAQYPVFSGEEYEDINQLVRNFIFAEIDEWSEGNADLVEADSGFDYSDDYSQYYVNIGYDITYRANDMISIIFSGNFDLKSAAHPTQVFWSLNIDPLTASQVRFSDRYAADEELYTIYRENAQKALAGTVLADVDLAKYLCSAESFIDSIMQDDSVCFYYTEEGVGISCPVEHVIGDHIEAVIPYEVMEGFKNVGTQESSDEPPFDPTAAEDYDYICEMAESDVRFKWVKAFVEKDVTTCADMMQIFDKKYWSERNYKYYEWFEYLNLLEFGGYSVELTEKDERGNDTLYFTFEIARSDYDVFPAGTYKYEVYEGMMSHTGWSRVDKEEPKLDGWLYSNVKYFVQMLTLDKNSDNWKHATDGIFLTVFMHNRENGRLEGDFISEEILQAEAMAAFGVEDFVPGDGFAHTTEGGYYIRGRGGPMAQYEISKVEVNGDVTDIYVQFFADPMDTVKSYYVKYSFEKTGGDYPYRMLSIDILDEGVYPPFFWSV